MKAIVCYIGWLMIYLILVIKADGKEGAGIFGAIISLIILSGVVAVLWMGGA